MIKKGAAAAVLSQMIALRTAKRAGPRLSLGRLPNGQPVRWASNSDIPGRRPQARRRRRGGGFRRYLGVFSVTAVAGLAYYASKATNARPTSTRPPAKVTIAKAELGFEQSPLREQQQRAGGSGGGGTSSDAAYHEELSPQHRQIKNSLQNPGVYAWGSNAGRAVAPDSPDAVVKAPRRIRFFDGQLLRDLYLDRDAGVAVSENGDIYQWGAAYWGKDLPPPATRPAKPATSTASPTGSSTTTVANPVATLTGRNIAKVAVSQDRILALSSSGTVYSLPIARADQQQPLPAARTPPATASSSPSWWQRLLWRSPAANGSAQPAVHYRIVAPGGLGWGERVVDVRSGREHCLLLTSRGRVFSAVSSSESFPSRGQLGVPGLTWQTRPADVPLDQPHEVPGLRGIAAAQIATGDYHSLVRSRDGRIFAFGDNAAGQLGLPATSAFPLSDTPVELPIAKLYANSNDNSRTAAGGFMPVQPPPRVSVTSVAAGGANSFFMVSAEVAGAAANKAAAGTAQPTVSADTWACGSGLYGSLGTGKWTHITTGGPSKVKALSGLAEYSEAVGRMVPIRVASLAVGATHASAVLGNATQVSTKDVNWGADVLWWGGNEFYQLGTGKRNNVAEPMHIAPLEGRSEAAAAAAAVTGEDRSLALDLMRERLEIAPRATVRLLADGKSRKVTMEQRVVCGRLVSGVYSGV